MGENDILRSLKITDQLGPNKFILDEKLTKWRIK